MFQLFLWIIYIVGILVTVWYKILYMKTLHMLIVPSCMLLLCHNFHHDVTISRVSCVKKINFVSGTMKKDENIVALTGTEFKVWTMWSAPYSTTNLLCDRCKTKFFWFLDALLLHDQSIYMYCWKRWKYVALFLPKATACFVPSNYYMYIQKCISQTV